MSSFAYPVPSLYKNDPGRQAATTILTSQLTGVYSSYTPTWTSTGTQPVLNNGTLTGAYLQIGKLVVGSINLTAGSTTTFGTGFYLLSLPIAAAGAGGTPVGICLALDAGVADYTLTATINTSTTVFLKSAASPSAAASPTSPFTFGSGDGVIVNFFYQAA